MFIPLYDSNHLRSISLQYVTFGLIALNVVAYLCTSLGGEQFTNAAVLGLGFIPSVVHDTAELAPQFVVIPESLSYLSYAFLHADIFHLGGNMLFLWVFGDNVEDALGHVRYLVFYLACAVAGAFVHGLVAPDSQEPLIGASGAIAGVVTAYLILFPRVKVWILAFARIPLRIPAYIVLALWIFLQVVMFLAGGEDQVSWACHVGGIVAGAVLVLILRRRDVPLEDEEIVVAPASIDAEPIVPVEEPPAAVSAPRWGRQ
ncbi:rhomboid family intramembrane serine protease [Ollibium composti]|uniref:Rhomboid family intramembrane serine protease n=1 Tax=Ollibium composti TaxID=2675109 RepID=A0ABY2Q4V1_9HYPH|nr:rhomboid family intramembrane serine protease [Mesorhizobium composti]THF55041.1 rhomboid family intramembrane serine protease [Mesorhizobium composti]